MNQPDLQALITDCGVHEALGPTGRGWAIEQNSFELSTVLSELPPFKTVLEIGTGHKAGLARFLHTYLLCDVTTIDNKDYGHNLPGITFIVAGKPIDMPPFDVVIIDGDNTYTQVSNDYGWYSQFATKAVVITRIAGLRGCDGIAQWWNEVAYTKTGNRLRKGYRQVIAEGDNRAGIGWVIK